MRPTTVVWLVVAGGVVVGVVAEALSAGPDPAVWIPDLLVGWVSIGCGALVLLRQPASRMGLLLAAAGFIWFIGNIGALEVPAVAVVAGQLRLIHRAVLLQAALTVPSGRTSNRPELGIIVVTYVLWSLPGVATMPVVSIGLGVLVSMAALGRILSAPPPERRARLVGLAATALLGGTFAVASVVHAALPSGEGDRAILLIDQVAVVAAVVALTVATLIPRLRADSVTDVLVRAAQPRSGAVRAALADAVGDASMELGYWHAPSGRYLDASGEAISLPGRDDPRSVLEIDVEGTPAAVLVHDPAALEGQSLVEAVRGATSLAAANARLRSSLLDQLADVRASRRRLVLAADAELARLERRIDGGPLRRARELAASLAGVQTAATAARAPAVAEHLDRARAALSAAAEELMTLAKGLHPATAVGNGLAGALGQMAARSSVPIDVAYEAGELPEAVAIAAYYVCSEAIANALKHAEASAVRVHAWRDGRRLLIDISDDGVGGADPSAGSGLRGLQDRVEALDGRVDLVSAPGAGTRLVAAIPLPAEAP